MMKLCSNPNKLSQNESSVLILGKDNFVDRKSFHLIEGRKVNEEVLGVSSTTCHHINVGALYQVLCGIHWEKKPIQYRHDAGNKKYEVVSFKKMPMLHCNNIHASVYIFCKEQVFNNLKILRRLTEGAVNVDKDFKTKSRSIFLFHLPDF
ncbi:hypothetical protein CEXT_271851 [Caerostris extrusa]|uniref:Uncharacterized protein n=1 Tax=Caerostris extrusa TaxID=172846 RepID=A0AAV4NQ49_CAEEX|nr:hypothetical protein CEXT_271851 [Caerostris extrusa]